MFKKIGIFVKENSSKSVDENALDSMLSFFTDQNIKLYIDDSSNYNNDKGEYLSHKEFSENIDLLVVFGGDGRVSRSYFHENSFGRDLYEGERKGSTKFGIHPV